MYKRPTFEQAWQKLFETLPPHERMEILSNPRGNKSSVHAQQAFSLAGGVSRKKMIGAEDGR